MRVEDLQQYSTHCDVNTSELRQLTNEEVVECMEDVKDEAKTSTEINEGCLLV